MIVNIQKTTVSEMERNANFSALFAEYAAESALHDLPPPDQKLASYRTLEGSGFFHAFGAFDGDKLIGFVTLLLPVIPHYSAVVGVTESFFVGKEYRKSGAGLKLLHTAEQHAREAGSPVLMVSAPTGGRLAEVLPRRGYKETNRVFLRKLVDA